MTGPENYREAERMAGHCALQVAEADHDHDGDGYVSETTWAYIALAQVHATLAHAAATADAARLAESHPAWAAVHS